MRFKVSNIILLLAIVLLLLSCATTKRVPKGSFLLRDNIIQVNDTLAKDDAPYTLLLQKRNTRFLGVPIRLGLYHLSKKNADSAYTAWLQKKPSRTRFLTQWLSAKQVERLRYSFIVSGYSNFFKKSGEAPVIFDPNKIEKTKNRLVAYYFNNGYLDSSVNHTIDTVAPKKITVHYNVRTGKQYLIDSLKHRIETPELNSLYEKPDYKSLLKPQQAYNTKTITAERKQITSYFRNNGAFYFRESNIIHKLDTIDTHGKVNVILTISDPVVRDLETDSLIKKPFQLYTIDTVNVFIDNAVEKNTQHYIDTVYYQNYRFLSTKKLNINPKALVNALFITPNSVFREQDRLLTSQALANLKLFQYPNIQYLENSKSGLNNNIFLSTRKKFSFNPAIDFLHSNIQDFGISGELSVTLRNIFRNAENLEIATRGSIGSSQQASNPSQVFFNLVEYGSDVRLYFPRIFFPFRTSWLIKREMFPTTQINYTMSRQINIGLDKENYSAMISYNWHPQKKNTFRVDLLNAQFIRNLNVNNYFTVYNASYQTLNSYAQTYNTNTDYIDANGDLTNIGALNFMNDVVNNQIELPYTDYKIISSIEERRRRLIENNLIFSSNITYTKNTQTDFLDNTFSVLKLKLETAGNLLSLITRYTQDELSNNQNQTVFGVEYAQYAKTEFDFIKHFEITNQGIIALRTFFGFAIPYGNSSNIPFLKSYFAGGSNDNRAWQPYQLGPGSSGSIYDFNEANLKMAVSAEYRFNIFGKTNGALFADAGNIWNALDDVDTQANRFTGFKSLKDIALGTGLGIRYDFGFFVFRLDWGFKTYNPALPENTRWFTDLSLPQSVLNFGINYPF